MDSSMNNYLIELEKKIPEFASSSDLVKLGIFSSQAALCKARKRGDSPTYIKYSAGRIMYPKHCVIEFLKKRIVEEK